MTIGKIIGVSGYPRSGKTTFIQYATKQYDIHGRFLEDLPKSMAGAVMEHTRHEDDEYSVSKYSAEVCGITVSDLYNEMTSKIIDLYGKEFLIKHAVRTAESAAGDINLIVDNVRFRCEADILRNLGGSIVSVRRHTDSMCDLDHPLYREIESLDPDFVIWNDESFAELSKSVDDVMLAVEVGVRHQTTTISDNPQLARLLQAARSSAQQANTGNQLVSSATYSGITITNTIFKTGA